MSQPEIMDLDDDDDLDHNYPNQRRRSLSDSNFEAFFATNRNNSAKENDDSSVSRNSINNMDSASNEQSKAHHKDSDNEFKILMYLDEKIDNDHEEDEPAEHHDTEHDEVTKDKNVQVEKKLDFLFRQEVPINDLYFEAPESRTQPASKPQQGGQPEGINSFFSNDMGMNSVTFRTEPH